VPSVLLPRGDSTHATHDAHAIAGLRNVGYKSLLRKYGISVISMHEQVDESPAGMLLEGMIELDFGHLPRNQLAGKWQPHGGLYCSGIGG
jgi:hypothetical protein